MRVKARDDVGEGAENVIFEKDEAVHTGGHPHGPTNGAGSGAMVGRAPGERCDRNTGLRARDGVVDLKVTAAHRQQDTAPYRSAVRAVEVHNLANILVVAETGFNVESTLGVAIEICLIFHGNPRVGFVRGEEGSDVITVSALVNVHARNGVRDSPRDLILNTDDTVLLGDQPNGATNGECGRPIVSWAPGDFCDGGFHANHLHTGTGELEGTLVGRVHLDLLQVQKASTILARLVIGVPSFVNFEIKLV
mmetsp:Transcript_15411/g.33317  ORF Transcript_15411/g.33317 Transcript_15411/m.33317 type:complete len:250 (-) Transcript_15411:236-985(-)